MPTFQWTSMLSATLLAISAACLIIVNYREYILNHDILRRVIFAGDVCRSTEHCRDELHNLVDLSWYSPNSTFINNLTSAINSTGIYGFVFNNSVTPPSSPYGTYNWCNMPHVRAQEYIVPPVEYQLEYVEVIHRHHKRTPYAANLFPHEHDYWNCDDEKNFYYAALNADGTAVRTNWQGYSSESNPFAIRASGGSCQFPQITANGLLDSRQHGRDLYAVYHDLLRFLPDKFDDEKVQYRVTNNVITSQVASQIIVGMFSSLTDSPVPVFVQSASVDSLEPSYSCPTSKAIRLKYGVGSHALNWTQHLFESTALFTKLDAVSRVSPNDPAWHESFDHYFDNLSSRLCHQKQLPCHPSDSKLCILEEDVNAVFRMGEYEYSFLYRDSPSSLQASVADFGVWMAEMASNLREAMCGNTTDTRNRTRLIYRHNIAHDGSISRLLSILQIDVMVWPGMGAEVVFELYRNRADWFVRVLWGGQILRSSHPGLKLMDLIPVETLLAYIDGLVGVKGVKIPTLCFEEIDSTTYREDKNTRDV